jgi:hypothetical protein
MDTQKDDENENDPFETIKTEKNNPVKKEFESGSLEVRSFRKMN